MARQSGVRGNVETLPSGAVRVRAYAGVDPVGKKRHDLREIVPPGPQQRAEVRKVRARLTAQIEEQRHPRTNATVNQLLSRYMRQFDGAPRTRDHYESCIRNHIRPFLGKVKLANVDADILDSFYAELRRCRDHCTGPYLQHRTDQPHGCDERCCPHVCRPLGASGIRHIHFILSGAFKRAVRWRWVSVNPVGQAEPPAAPTPKPAPPSAEEAARILNEAWRDPDWGAFVWLAMTSGARRGELCALRWSDVDLDPERAVLWLRRAIARGDAGWIESGTKTHQQRRVALDAETLAMLAEHRERWDARAAAFGGALAPDAFVFSPVPDGASFHRPDPVTRRYERLAKRLGIHTTLHKLRHYSATELIAAGVDVRTVAGRLGHSGGGTTTLRTYTAWVSEADQRAAGSVSARMPRPNRDDATERAKTDPRSTYERAAAEIRRRIVAGELPHGRPAPSQKEIAAEFDVSVGTAHRVAGLLKEWSVVEQRAGERRAVVVRPEMPSEPPAPAPVAAAQPDRREPLDLEVLRAGEAVRKLRAEADPNSTAELRQLLSDAVKRNGGSDEELGEYEMNVRYAGERGLITTFVATTRE